MSITEVSVNGREYPLAPMDIPMADSPTAEWMAITPQVAERWLRVNHLNRGLRLRAAAAQTRDMSTGKWAINGETIKISRPLTKGEVEDLPEGQPLFLDGQHRFEACIDSGVPFVTLVVYGLEPEARNTMDTGITRTMGDVLKMNGEANAPVAASILRRVWMWENGDHKFSGNGKPTHAELMELLDRERDAVLRASEKGYYIRTGFRDVSPAVAGVAYYLCAKVAPDEAPEFFERLRDGAELSVGSPLLTLRNRLSRERVERRNNMPYYQLGLILKAWNIYREGGTIVKLQHTPEDAVPIPK
jgi:hypothetical protein